MESVYENSISLDTDVANTTLQTNNGAKQHEC